MRRGGPFSRTALTGVLVLLLAAGGAGWFFVARSNSSPYQNPVVAHDAPDPSVM
ncbi:MAG: hypothetical protein H0V97_01185, partial [Actinobacteria bacterium]|nr:hypothetical protein [Actinomycetota bacterium]